MLALHLCGVRDNFTVNACHHLCGVRDSLANAERDEGSWGYSVAVRERNGAKRSGVEPAERLCWGLWSGFWPTRPCWPLSTRASGGHEGVSPCDHSLRVLSTRFTGYPSPLIREP